MAKPMSLLKLIAILVATPIIHLPILFWPAGTLRWTAGWLYVAIFMVYAVGVSIYLSRHDPELLRERTDYSLPPHIWDRWILLGLSVAMIGEYVVIGLDERFGWSAIPLGLRALGFAGVAASLFGMFLVMRENTFLSRVVEVQAERGHTVVTTGPYAVVRHPLYAAFILLMTALPVALDAWTGLWFVVPFTALIAARTALEDRLLHAELEGYPDYARRTRYRLVPGVW